MDAPARLRLPARPENIPALRELALARARLVGLAPPQVQRADLVLEEALMNVIHHAYAGKGGDMELECLPSEPGVLHMVLRDWGPPFDPLRQPGLEEGLEANLVASLEERCLGGMGLFFIRTMARAEYRREDDANVLSLRIGPGGD